MFNTCPTGRCQVQKAAGCIIGKESYSLQQLQRQCFNPSVRTIQNQSLTMNLQVKPGACPENGRDRDIAHLHHSTHYTVAAEANLRRFKKALSSSPPTSAGRLLHVPSWQRQLVLQGGQKRKNSSSSSPAKRRSDHLWSFQRMCCWTSDILQCEVPETYSDFAIQYVDLCVFAGPNGERDLLNF